MTKNILLVDAVMDKPLNVPCRLPTIWELVNEPVESHAERLNRHGRSFRYVPCNQQEFREMLRLRFVTPFPCAETKNR